jgi:hypothetical protein
MGDLLMLTLIKHVKDGVKASRKNAQELTN